MKKQIISNDEQKLNIVILRNDSEEICVKGISKCHPDDVYDKEKGIQIANTKAWIKYYEALAKVNKKLIGFHTDMLEWYQGRVNEDKAVYEMAMSKLPALKEELNKAVGE